MTTNTQPALTAELQTTLRIFRLIRLLLQKPPKTTRQLAERLEKSPRTIQRYLKLLEELDYPIEHDFQSRYFLTDDFGKEIRSTFSAEEAQLLKDLLLQAAHAHPLQDRLLKKLFLHSDLYPLADSLLKAHTHQLIHELARAIEFRKQVILHNYHSVHGQTFSDRLVEPLAFTENYTLLTAYEPESGIEKIYKLERIEAVTRLDTNQTHRQESIAPDLFGMAGPKKITVTLRLSHRAYRLMQEEHPLAKPLLSSKDGHYYFEGTVQSVIGIGRFILGLCGEIQVLHPPELKEYLNERVKDVEF